MAKNLVIDYDTFGSLEPEEYEPIGVVIEDGTGDVAIRYTSEAEEDDHPRYHAMVRHLEPSREAWNRRAEEQDWNQIFGRLVNQSYLGIKFRIGTFVDDDMTVDEAFDRFVTNRETTEDISVDDERVTSGY